MLLALASAVFLGSESLVTRDHILLSQISDYLLFVASYDSQGYDGGIRPRLHTGLSSDFMRLFMNALWFISAGRTE
jgi:hypothetical protein